MRVGFTGSPAWRLSLRRLSAPPSEGTARYLRLKDRAFAGLKEALGTERRCGVL